MKEDVMAGTGMGNTKPTIGTKKANRFSAFTKAELGLCLSLLDHAARRGVNTLEQEIVDEVVRRGDDEGRV